MTDSPANPSRESLDDLLRRVEGASGLDQEMFADIAAAPLPLIFGKLQPLEINSPDWIFRNRVYEFLRAQAWIDAALALVERLIPGAWVRMGTAGWAELPNPRGTGGSSSGRANTLPLAILAALLRALQSQSDPTPKDKTDAR